MREKITNHSEFLESDPIFDGEGKEVFDNTDGSQYIPVAIVEGLLDLLTDTHWSTNNFVYGSSKRVLKPNEEVGYIGGKVELTVTYGNITRTLTGVCDIKVDDLIAKTINEKDNESYQATVLSHCLCNAAKKLGNRFGRSLNGRGVNKVEDKKEMPLPVPDKGVIKLWLKYCEDGDIKMQEIFLTIYDNQTLHNAIKK